MSPPPFDLLTEPFIPCRFLGGAPRDVGLRKALGEAHAVQSVDDASPLFLAGIHRLMLAILHRAFGPEDGAAWERLYRAGRFPGRELDAYFGRWRERFDLYHPERPFFQDPFLDNGARNGVNQLVRERARGNNPTLFDHTDEDPPPLLSPLEVARALIADQAFAIGGGKSKVNLAGGRVVERYTSSSPLVGGVVVLARGASLFETLMFNLGRYRDDRGRDRPVWEAEPFVRPCDDEAGPRGPLDQLTWQYRSVRLYLEADGRVRHMAYAQGRALKEPARHRDPMLAYEKNTEKGDSPIRFQEAKATWRDSTALLQWARDERGKERECRRPAALNWLGLLVEDGRVEARVFPLALLGLCTEKGKAKVHFWRHETLPVPAAYLTDHGLVADLADALLWAEEVGQALRKAAAVTAQELLTAGGRSADKKALWDLVDSLAADGLYWSRLAGPFLDLVRELPGDPEHRKERRAGWFIHTLRPAALDAWTHTVDRADQRERKRRAAVCGEVALRRQLNKAAKRFGLDLPAREGGSS